MDIIELYLFDYFIFYPNICKLLYCDVDNCFVVDF